MRRVFREVTRQFLSGDRRELPPLEPALRAGLFREGLLGIYALLAGERQTLLEEVAREGRWRQRLAEIDEALQHRGCRALAFKGASCLLLRLYPFAGLRPLSDIDLVIWPHDKALLLETLTRLGYRKVSDTPLVLSRDNAQLDLHTHPLGRQQWVFDFSLETALQRCRPLLGGGLYAFHPEDELTLTLLHASKHCYRRQIWLIDIALMLRSTGPAGPEPYLSHARWLLNEEPLLRRWETHYLQRCATGRAPEMLGMLLPLLASPRRAWRWRYLRELLQPQGSSWRQRLREWQTLWKRLTG